MFYDIKELTLIFEKAQSQIEQEAEAQKDYTNQQDAKIVEYR